MSPEIPDTPIGLAFAVFFLLAQLGDRLIRGWFWRLHQSDRAAHVEALAKAPENVRPVIEAHEPQPPPGFGPLAVVLAAGALAGLVAGAARGELQLARRLVLQDELAAAPPLSEPHSSPPSAALPLLASAAPGTGYCTKASDCGSGCSCDRNKCNCSSGKPAALPSQRTQPRRVASLDGALGDHPNLPWHVTPIASPLQ